MQKSPAKRAEASRNIWMILGMTALSFLVSFVLYSGGEKNGVILLSIALGLSSLVGTMISYQFGFYVCLILGFFLFVPGRILGDEFPVGVLLDLQILATFASLLVSGLYRKKSILEHASHPITYVYLAYTGFLFVQAFNPNMLSLAGWFLIVRKFLQFLLIYLIGLNLFHSLENIRKFLKVILILSFLVAVYGCYQKWFGFLPFEMNWIYAKTMRIGLYMLYDGTFRVFSSLSDPAAFGITMASFSLLAMVFAINHPRGLIRFALLVALVFLLMGVAYSGTRTAYFIITVGVLLYIMLTINRVRTAVFTAVAASVFILILWGPFYGNTVVNRIRTTFLFSEEESLEVRDLNRMRIQPYVHSHPIGGGLATSGEQGLEYNPGHRLAGFPPDSGYVKAAIETGWIGLFLQCLIYFFILKYAIRGYYSVRNSEVKMMYLAVVISQFAFIIAQYAQEAIAQTPGFLLFYSSNALIVQLVKVDKKEI